MNVKASIEYFKHNQLETIKGVRKLNDDIYMIDYRNEYYLDDVLEKGVSSIPDLLGFIGKKLCGGFNPFGSVKTEIGCTTFNCRTPEGNAILARNFDFKDAPCTVIWTHPKNGYASISVTDNNMMIYGRSLRPTDSVRKYRTLLAPYIPMDGVNEKGLSVAVLELKHPAVNGRDTSKGNITTTCLIRALLDKCADIGEALEMFGKFNMHDSLFCAYHYQIADASGRSVIVEYDWTGEDLKLNVYTPEDFGSEHGVQSCANFCVNRNIVNEEKDFGHERAALAFDRAERNGGVLTERQAMDLLKDVRLTYKHENYPWRISSLWSALYDCTDKKLTLCAAMKYDVMYEFSVNAPYEYKTV